jgi:neopullulanase
MHEGPPAWAKDAVFYQVFPDRLARSGQVQPPGDLEPWDAPPSPHGFKGGDLYGVIEHLERLEGLGVNALYLNPIFASASNHRYHTDDYLAVDPLLGGDEALVALLEAAHARDMRVMLDGVFNHCGRGWWPFHHVLENGAASPYVGWLHLAEDVLAGRRGIVAYPSAELTAEIGRRRAAGARSGSASREILGYECWWDLPALPKIDLTMPAAREHVLEAVESWTRLGVDGWRLDVAEEVGEDFWRAFRSRVRAVDPESYLVAEVWHHKPEWLQGDLFDAFMNYPLTEAILGFAAQGRLDTDQVLPAEYVGALRALDGAGLWARIEELRAVNPPDATAVQLNLLGSHDTPRVRTLCGGDLDAVRLATLLQMTLPGAPCIYYGDEIGLEGGMDPACRGAFPIEPAAWDREPYAWTAALAALRHSSRALRDGELTVLNAGGAGIAYERRAGDDAYVVVVNAGEEPLAWELSLPADRSTAELVPLPPVGDGDPVATVSERVLQVAVPARSGAVVRLG